MWPHFFPLAIDPNNEERFITSTVAWSGSAPNKILLSNDGGNNWSDISGNLPDGAGASSIVFDPKGEYVYITRYAGSVYRLKIKS